MPTQSATSEGMFMAILHGLLTGFLFPILPFFFFREMPLPNFFDAEAEAIRQATPPDATGASSGGRRGRQADRVGGGASSSASVPDARALPAQTPEMELLLDLTSSDRIGSEVVPSNVFNSKSQVRDQAVRNGCAAADILTDGHHARAGDQRRIRGSAVLELEQNTSYPYFQMDCKCSISRFAARGTSSRCASNVQLVKTMITEQGVSLDRADPDCPWKYNDQAYICAL